MKKYQNSFLISIFCTLMIISCTILKKEKPKKIFLPSDTAFHYEGRVDFQHPEAPSFSWSGVNFSFRFRGSTSCKLFLKTMAANKVDYYQIIVDDKLPFVLKTHVDTFFYELAKDLDSNQEHQITVFKRTEASVSKGTFLGVQLDEKGTLLPWVDKKEMQIEFVGNSITCGYGNEGDNQHCRFSAATENNYMAYGAITARKLNAAYMAVAISGFGMYRSYSGDTLQVMSRYYDKIYIDSAKVWKSENWHPKFTVVNIGTNDFAKGIPDSVKFTTKYLEFIQQIKKAHPETKIICVSGPMMNDNWPPKTFALTHLNNYLKEIAKKSNQKLGKQDVYFFGLTKQGQFGYGCDWHPNIKQHEYNAEELYQFILSIMNQ